VPLSGSTWRPGPSIDPDVAWLDINGGLTLYVWVEHRAVVRGQLLITHAQGQQTLVWEGTIGTAATDHLLTCTRCVSVADQYFVVYWMDYDSNAGTYVLESRYSDMEALNSAVSWTANSDITPDDAGLYDVKQVENPSSTGEYMLAWASSTSQVIVRRVIGPNHTTDVTWSTTITTNHDDRVLAVHGDAEAGNNNGGVLVVVQSADVSDNNLDGHVIDYSDGTSVGSFTIYATDDADFAAVGIARVSPPGDPTNACAAVIAEYQDTAIDTVLGFNVTEDDYVHFLVCQAVRLTATPTTLGNPHVTANLNMMSKPYSYTDAEGDRHVYCGLGYKTVNYPAQWTQSVGFVCDMGFQHWGEATNTIRPRPCLTLNLANVDADIHGANTEASGQVSNGQGKRINHLSNWIPGPQSLLCDTRKSRTVAWGMWSRLTSVEDGTAVADVTPGGSAPAPAGAAVRGIVHMLEDAWTANRDDLETAIAPSINFHSSNPLSLYASANTGEALLIAGGTPHLYDGKAIVELGFSWDPEIVFIVDNPTGAATIAAGEYTYLAVYEWTDARGQLHRSGHGRPVTFDNDGNDNPLVVVRTMTISNRDAEWLYPDAQHITIALYRNTLATPNRYFRLHSTEINLWTPADIPVNDPTVWAIAIHDGLHDNALAGAPELSYVADGAQQNQFPPFQPPAAHLVANWKNRAWLPSSENPKDLYYSYPHEGSALTGKLAPEFSQFFIFRLDSINGDVTGLQPMDDAMIVFTRDGIYSLSGDGFVGLDTVTSSLSLQVLHEGTGCIEPRSIALTPAGIIFQSYKGMYLLDKGGQLDFISTGAPVEDLIRTAGNVRSGEHLPDRHLVAFVANGAVEDSPSVIKYDYYHRMWSTAELQPPNTDTWLSSTAAGCVWRGNERDASHVVLCQGGLLIERGKDDSTPYRDEDDGGAIEAIRMDIETGWINLAGIAGYKRVREIGVQTEITNASPLYAELDYDISGTYSLASPELKVFDTPAPAYLRLRPSIQKLTAFRLRLYEPSSSPATETRKINGITVHVGRKKGPRKVAGSQQG
jgi:hypothetical protein